MNSTTPSTYTFTADELETIQKHVAKYPQRQSAVMPVLWIAQEKFGWLSPEAMQLVADTLQLPYAHVYGVATFYSQYLKENRAKHLLEICTCYTCGECGGSQLMNYIKEKLRCDEKGVSEDKLVWVREAECLGACDSAPVAQVNNRRTVFNLTPEKIDNLLADLKKNKLPEFESIALKDQSQL